ncbi:MAG: hypothetical protein CVU22_21380 [Betaproteobacteria bacterium HGW-Betaproteobacteria-16]|nr:MAG: hypothetical protein CVU22_21380 [Betaproteobacteria bacterium HGW-Betaproteobacteria-16]
MNTTTHAQLTDTQFLAAFEQCELTGAQFDHTGHLRIACLWLQRCPLDEAIQKTCTGIQRLATHLGSPGKFHRTVTEALVRLMAHRGAASLSWVEFLHATPELTSDARALLARHYSNQRLEDPRARLEFLEPDREPLPS